MVLPSTLVAEFEKIAKPNTDKPPYGIETCGILAGKLVSPVQSLPYSTRGPCVWRVVQQCVACSKDGILMLLHMRVARYNAGEIAWHEQRTSTAV